jgi:hypothetical protein
LNQVPQTPGKDFNVITVSFSDDEDPSHALAGIAIALPVVMALLQKWFPARHGAGPGFGVVNLSMFIFMVMGMLDRMVA